LLIIHHLGVSQSERVVWLMEELALPYQSSGTGAAPTAGAASYLALHPAATAPVFRTAIGRLRVSGHLEYVCHQYADGRLTVSPDQPNFYDYVYWMPLQQ